MYEGQISSDLNLIQQLRSLILPCLLDELKPSTQLKSEIGFEPILRQIKNNLWHKSRKAPDDDTVF